MDTDEAIESVKSDRIYTVIGLSEEKQSLKIENKPQPADFNFRVYIIFCTCAIAKEVSYIVVCLTSVRQSVSDVQAQFWIPEFTASYIKNSNFFSKKYG